MTTLTLEYDKDVRAYDMRAHVINHEMLINIYDVSTFSLTHTNGNRSYERRVWSRENECGYCIGNIILLLFGQRIFP